MSEPTEREFLEGLRPEDEWEHRMSDTPKAVKELFVRELNGVTARLAGLSLYNYVTATVPEVLAWLQEQNVGEVGWIGDSSVDELFDAARRFASLTSPETIEVLRSSWGRIRERLTSQTTETDLWNAISILDHHFGAVLRSVEEGTE